MLSGLDDTAKIQEISKLRGSLNAIKLICEAIIQDGKLDDMVFEFDEDGKALLARFIKLCEEAL